jgi:hypothetical protein
MSYSYRQISGTLDEVYIILFEHEAFDKHVLKMQSLVMSRKVLHYKVLLRHQIPLPITKKTEHN